MLRGAAASPSPGGPSRGARSIVSRRGDVSFPYFFPRSTMATMTAVQVPEAEGDFEVVETEIPEPGPGEARFRVVLDVAGS